MTVAGQTDKLSMDELREMFGPSLPMDAVKLIWPEFFLKEGEVPHFDPLSVLRSKLRALARPSPDEQAEVVGWVTADILAAMKRGERVASGWKRSADFCIPLYASPSVVAKGGVAAETIDYVMQYGGNCRDCADENGTCPHSGLPCDVKSARKAIGFVLRAIAYGTRRGHLAALDEGIREGWPEHASPLPWKYVASASPSSASAIDWIEDATGGIVVEHVGHIDGPAICAAVNGPTPPSRGEGE